VRKPIPAFHKAQMTMIMRGLYERYLPWLQARKKRYGHLNGWPSTQSDGFWQGPPGEVAARMVAYRFSFGVDSWRGVLNQISSQK